MILRNYTVRTSQNSPLSGTIIIPVIATIDLWYEVCMVSSVCFCVILYTSLLMQSHDCLSKGNTLEVCVSHMKRKLCPAYPVVSAYMTAIEAALSWKLKMKLCWYISLAGAWYYQFCWNESTVDWIQIDGLAQELLEFLQACTRPSKCRWRYSGCLPGLRTRFTPCRL